MPFIRKSLKPRPGPVKRPAAPFPDTGLYFPPLVLFAFRFIWTQTQNCRMLMHTAAPLCPKCNMSYANTSVRPQHIVLFPDSSGRIVSLRTPLTGMEMKKEKTTRFRVWSFLGAPGGIRTPDLLVRSQTLYPTELRAHMLICLDSVTIIYAPPPNVKPSFPAFYDFLFVHCITPSENPGQKQKKTPRSLRGVFFTHPQTGKGCSLNEAAYGFVNPPPKDGCHP